MLHRFFRARHAIGKMDRALIADGVYAYLRRRRSLEAQAGATDPHHLALAVAVRELGHSIRELGAVVSAADAQWLAEFKSRGTDRAADPAVAADLPDWLWTRLGDALGESERDGARARLAGAGAARPARRTR